MKAGEANGSKAAAPLATCSILTIVAAFVGCASQTSRVDEMQPYAIKSAQQRGSAELDCAGATAQVITKK